MNKDVTFQSLSRAAKELSAMVILDSADYLFKLWPDGEIAHVTFGDAIQPASDLKALKDRAVQEIVQPEFADDLTQIMERARNGRPTESIDVRHSALIGNGSAARYSAHLSGDGRNLMLIGRSLPTNLTPIEQAVDAEIAEYRGSSYRSMEMQYHHLFSSAIEGLLMLDSDGHIEDANIHASEMLSTETEDLIGGQLSDHLRFQAQDQDLHFPSATQTVSNVIDAPVMARGSDTALQMTCRAIRGLNCVQHVVRLQKVEQRVCDSASSTFLHTRELLHKTDIPVGIVDRSGCITWSNGPFDRLQAGGMASVLSVADMLGISDATLQQLLNDAEQNDRVITTLSALNGHLKAARDLHIWVIAIPTAQPVGFGLMFRIVGEPAAIADENAQEFSALAKLVGQAPMKMLVRRSTDVLERSCIEAALRLTGNNRAAAATALGLSRQSLYLKMHQHHLL